MIDDLIKDNYLRLLIAIEYSTNEYKEKVYGVYDTKSNGCVLMVVKDIKDIADFFKTTCGSIRSMMTRNQLIRNRFEVVKFEQNIETIEELLDLTNEDSLEDMLLMQKVKL